MHISQPELPTLLISVIFLLHTREPTIKSDNRLVHMFSYRSSAAYGHACLQACVVPSAPFIFNTSINDAENIHITI